jgi:hypothetical protein
MPIAGSTTTFLYVSAPWALLEILLQAVTDQPPLPDLLKLFNLATLHPVESMQFVQKTEELHPANVFKTTLAIPM